MRNGILIISILFVLLNLNLSAAEDTSKTFQLVVAKLGDGRGTITSSPPGIHCGDGAKDCTAVFRSGTPVTLAPTEIQEGSSFFIWSNTKGSTTPCDGLKDSCTFTITQNSSIAGTFRTGGEKKHKLDVTAQGTGKGVVRSQPPGINCGQGATNCTAMVLDDTEMTLIAEPTDTQSTFLNWSGATGSAQSCNNTTRWCVFSITEDTAVTANFQAGRESAAPSGDVTLVTTKTGNGAGLIVSSPAGIECGDGGNTCSASFTPGTSVTLNARPTTAGSRFGGWSGGTGSASTCMGAVSGPCSFVINEDSSVTGTFVQQ
jgi:hypothetical protein